MRRRHWHCRCASVRSAKMAQLTARKPCRFLTRGRRPRMRTSPRATHHRRELRRRQPLRVSLSLSRWPCTAKRTAPGCSTRMGPRPRDAAVWIPSHHRQPRRARSVLLRRPPRSRSTTIGGGAIIATTRRRRTSWTRSPLSQAAIARTGGTTRAVRRRRAVQSFGSGSGRGRRRPSLVTWAPAAWAAAPPRA